MINEITTSELILPEKSDGKVHFQNSKPANFLVPKCSWCNQEMALVEGDTIYGENWYHKNCWRMINITENKK